MLSLILTPAQRAVECSTRTEGVWLLYHTIAGCRCDLIQISSNRQSILLFLFYDLASLFVVQTWGAFNWKSHLKACECVMII
jgi:hypothetical protein